MTWDDASQSAHRTISDSAPELALGVSREVSRVEVSADALSKSVAAMLDAGWRLALVAAHDDREFAEPKSGASAATSGGASGATSGNSGDALGTGSSEASADSGEFRIVYAFTRPVGQRRELILRVDAADPRIPTLAGLSYPAGRFEREMYDLFGLVPRNHPLPRRLVLHGHWPGDAHPLRKDSTQLSGFQPDTSSYPFLQVTGTGVYDIPVGPIHAGLIEPGHFRFSVVGETILRMKARLWFLHRGMEKLFEGRAPQEAIGLAERISGDTAVGHSWAFVAAVEEALGITCDPAVQARRMVLLELERLHNHVADLGALANDVGYGIANVHAQRIRECLLRHNAAVTGHRLLRGAIGIGRADWQQAPDVEVLSDVDSDTAALVEMTLGHGIVLDRFRETAVLPEHRAQDIGVLGYVARASGLPIDARVDHPPAGLDLDLEPVVETGGDVMARYLVRAREVRQSLALLEHLLPLAEGRTGADSPTGAPGVLGAGRHRAKSRGSRSTDSRRREGDARPRSGSRAVANPPAPEPIAGAMPGSELPAASGPLAGMGIVEAWRGTLVHRVELGRDGRLSRVKIVDPSWFTWPGLPVALASTIVPDFPLANKSFNQSYAGNDL